MIDDFMGKGKTSFAIQFINENPDYSYIYCTPFLDEVDRISASCPDANFAAPTFFNGRKIDDFNALLMDGRNIVVTHATFTNATDDTLEYLKLGGRLSGAAALAGNILSIKPVVTIEDGEVKVIGKARGSKNGNNMLIQITKDLGGVDFSMPLCFGYSGLTDEMLQKYISDGATLYEGKTDKLNIVSVGPTIGTYTGPGAIAVAFFHP